MALQQLPTPTHDLAEARRDMEEHGYVLIADALSPGQVEAMRERLVEQGLAEGPSRGEQRSLNDKQLRYDVGGLLNKGEVFLELLDPTSLLHQVVSDTLRPSLEPVSAALWNLEQGFILSSVDGVVKRLEVATSGDETRQAHLNPVFHIDQAMVPTWLEYPVAVNSFYFLTEYTRDNGGTLVVPGSHRLAPPDWTSYADDEAIPIEAPAGTSLVVDGRLWHAAGINVNGELRIHIDCYYSAPWIRQRWPMSMNLRQDFVDRLTDAQLRLCGFDTMYQSEYGAFGGLGIIEPTLGRNNVTVKQQGIGELHLS